GSGDGRRDGFHLRAAGADELLDAQHADAAGHRVFRRGGRAEGGVSAVSLRRDAGAFAESGDQIRGGNAAGLVCGERGARGGAAGFAGAGRGGEGARRGAAGAGDRGGVTEGGRSDGGGRGAQKRASLATPSGGTGERFGIGARRAPSYSILWRRASLAVSSRGISLSVLSMKTGCLVFTQRLVSLKCLAGTFSMASPTVLAGRRR